MKKQHKYNLTVKWTGNRGQGTENYNSYDRSHVISAADKPDIQCSSDPSFLGDGAKYNPEELLVASLSACHMLWYLHLCSEAGIVVISYSDNAIGTMALADDGGGRFTEVNLHPEVVVTEKSMIVRANELHHKANKLCFIANSCNFPVYHKPSCTVESNSSKLT